MESILIELLYVIGDCCDDPQSLAALCRSSRRNYEALHLGLYRRRQASGTCQRFQNQDLHVEISSRINASLKAYGSLDIMSFRPRPEVSLTLIRPKLESCSWTRVTESALRGEKEFV